MGKKTALVRVYFPARARRALRVTQQVHNWQYLDGKFIHFPAQILAVTEETEGYFNVLFEAFRQDPRVYVMDSHPKALVCQERVTVRMAKHEDRWLVEEVMFQPCDLWILEGNWHVRQWIGANLTHLVRRCPLSLHDLVPIPDYKENWQKVEKMSDQELKEKAPELLPRHASSRTPSLPYRQSKFVDINKVLMDGVWDE